LRRSGGREQGDDGEGEKGSVHPGVSCVRARQIMKARSGQGV
jgi:hypothetical protein